MRRRDKYGTEGADRVYRQGRAAGDPELQGKIRNNNEGKGEQGQPRNINYFRSQRPHTIENFNCYCRGRSHHKPGAEYHCRANTIADYDTYFTHFPDGMFTTRAKRRIGEITAKVKMKKSPGKLALAPIQKKLLSNQRRLQDGKPAAFPVNALINGWQEALPLMQVGEK